MPPGNGSKMALGNYFPGVTTMKNFSINTNKLHAALAMLASAAISVTLIVWSIAALRS
jgi:hypothetical protein